jgi:hypothetical protein
MDLSETGYEHWRVMAVTMDRVQWPALLIELANGFCNVSF